MFFLLPSVLTHSSLFVEGVDHFWVGRGTGWEGAVILWSSRYTQAKKKKKREREKKKESIFKRK